MMKHPIFALLLAAALASPVPASAVDLARGLYHADVMATIAAGSRTLFPEPPAKPKQR
jgi:hypothetical protein